jgi:hypothetical protein
MNNTEEIVLILNKYLNNNGIKKCLDDEQFQNFLRDYYYWFKTTDVLNITENDLKSYSYVQKLSLRIVMNISLIESLYKEKGEDKIKQFFSNLDIKEKFLFNLIVNIEDATENEMAEAIFENNVRDIIEDYDRLRELENKLRLNLYLLSFLKNRKDLINEEFERRIKYLYALRSQIVHQGKVINALRLDFKSFSIPEVIPNSSFSEIIKIAFISSFPQKGIENKILKFEESRYGIYFEDILEDLIFMSLFRNKNLELKQEFLQNFNKKLLKILTNFSSDKNIDSSIKSQIQNYIIREIKNIKNINQGNN